MAELKDFNADDHEEQSFDTIPSGDYTVLIDNSEMKENKKKTGKNLSLTFKVVGEECNGRLLFENLCLDNPNDTAVKIAKGRLSSICKAVGVLKPSDTVELHNIPLVITVTVVKDTYVGGDAMKNEIKGFKQIGGASEATDKPKDTSKPF